MRCECRGFGRVKCAQCVERERLERRRVEAAVRSMERSGRESLRTVMSDGRLVVAVEELP